jgi:cell division protein FtsI (penicillin-binding protein 3)
MSFGYEVLVSPLQTLMLYNSVANGGKMMKPYLVNSILRSGLVVKQFEPEVLEESICSEATLKALRQSLEGVCSEEIGTGYKLFQPSLYKVAGKTGTALVANGNRGYSDHIYQSSFAGYFPANDPKYSCIVVIRNKPFAKKFYGAAVAGPVFKEVADKLYALDTKEQKQDDSRKISPDSSNFYYAGNYHDMVQVMDVLNVRFVDSSKKSDYSKMYSVGYKPVISEQPVTKSQMPDVRGMGLKDALFLLEDIGLNVQVRGRGKVSGQSLAPGLAINRKQEVLLELN